MTTVSREALYKASNNCSSHSNSRDVCFLHDAIGIGLFVEDIIILLSMMLKVYFDVLTKSRWRWSQLQELVVSLVASAQDRFVMRLTMDRHSEMFDEAQARE